MIFVDNAGADIVLGMLPFLRELLRLRCEVVLVANSLPAINDITAPELRSLLSAAAEVCPIIKAARQAAKRGRSSGCTKASRWWGCWVSSSGVQPVRV
jgi:type II pantothenate kinase